MLRTSIPATLAVLCVVVLSACGEKSEPDLGSIPPPPKPPETVPLATELKQLERQGTERPGPIAGSWTGTLRQKGLKPFSIRVEIVSLTRPRRNVVRYGEINCRGYWRFTGGQGSTVRFLETIDSGAGGNCKGKGVVSLTQPQADTDRLLYEFNGGGAVSKGTLKKR